MVDVAAATSSKLTYRVRALVCVQYVCIFYSNIVHKSFLCSSKQNKTKQQQRKENKTKLLAVYVLNKLNHLSCGFPVWILLIAPRAC